MNKQIPTLLVGDVVDKLGTLVKVFELATQHFHHLGFSVKRFSA